MTEKISQSRLPLWIALGLLFFTIVAAYIYQTNKAIEAQVSAEEKLSQENGVTEVQRPISEPDDELFSQETIVSEPTPKRDTEATSQALESGGEVEETPREPFLETVRVETDGAVLMAGTGLPNQKIYILLDDDIIETVAADERGDFVILFDLPYSAKIRVLSLKSDVDGVTVYSQQEVIISPAQISEPIVTAQADLSEEPEPETKLEQGPSSQESLAERQSADSDSQGTSKAENVLQGANKKEGLTSNTLIADAQDDATSDIEAVALETQVGKEELEEVQETKIVTETVVPADTETVTETVVPADTETVTETVIPADTETVTESQESVAQLGLVNEAKIESEKNTPGAPSSKLNQEQAAPVEIVTVEETETSEVVFPKKALDSVKPTDPIVESRSEAEKAPVVMIADNEGVRIIQSEAERTESDVALDTISYDDEGEINLAGRGKPAGFVRIYLDNTPISTAAMDETGQWHTALSEIDPGIYTLRVDQLDTKGQVSSRLETPFKRESLETLQAQLLALEDPARINVVTVQPGNTLWAIARERYGLGILYVRVFQANRDKIRDENLIYPGQIFELPD